MSALLVHHWYSQLLVERRVAESRSDAIAPPRFFINGGGSFGVLLHIAVVIILHRLIERALAIELEAKKKEWKGGHAAKHLPVVGATSTHHECSDAVGEKQSEEHTIEKYAPKETARLVLGTENIPARG